MVDVCCVHCDELYHVEESHLGREIRCLRCGMITRLERRVIITPSPSAPPVPHYGPVPPKPQPVAPPKRRSLARRWHPTVTFEVNRRTKVLAGVLLALLALMALDIWFGPSSQDSTPSHEVATANGAGSPSTQRVALPPAPAATKPEAPKTRSRSASILRPPSQLAARTRVVLPPCAVGWPVDRPPTGESLESGEVEGLPSDRYLTIFNGQSEDAAVRLADAASGLTFRFVYIRAGDSYTIRDVDPGSYSLLFETGREWVPHCKGFIRDEYIQETDEPVDFDPYTYGSITLYRVANGNAKAHSIDRKRFFQGDQNIELGQ